MTDPSSLLTPKEWLGVIGEPRTRLFVCGRKTVVRDWHREFTPPDELIYLITEHQAYGEIDGEACTLHPGDMIWVSAGVPFWLKLADPDKPVTLYHLRFETRASSGRRFMLGHDMWQTVEVFDQLHDEFRCKSPLRDYRLRGSLFLIFCQLFDAEQAAQKQRMFTETQRRTLYRYMAGKWHLRLTTQELASQLGLTPDYFARMFRHTFGYAPSQWLKRERIHHAATTIRESNARLAEIAADFGYDNPLYFSRQFREVMGCSPRDYRRRH